MPDTPLDWATIQTFHEPALNLAIEAHCYHRTWRHITTPGKVAWWAYTAHGKEWGSGKGPPQHTASWARTMALAYRYHVSQNFEVIDGIGDEAWHYEYGPDACLVVLESQGAHSARVALCRVALWAAVRQQQEVAAR